MYKPWWFSMIHMCELIQILTWILTGILIIYRYLKKRRFSTLKWYLVCENKLGIEVTGAIWKFLHFKIYFILFLDSHETKQFQNDSQITENHHESPKTYLRITKNHWESISDLSENHWELLRITKNQFQTIIENCQESMRISFRLICESPRINFRLINESARIIENHWESLRINFRLIWESPRIIENPQESMRISFRLIQEQLESIPGLFENQQESRINENYWELVTINKNQGLDLFKNQFQTYLRIIENWWESSRIIENHQESMRIRV